MSHQPKRISRLERLKCTYSCAVGNKGVPFSMAIGNGELMHECFPKHLRMGTARIKQDKETDEDGKKRGVRMERGKADTKKSPDGQPNQNTIIIIIIIIITNILWKYFIINGKRSMKFN